MPPPRPYYTAVHYAPPSEFAQRPIPSQLHRMRDPYIALSLSRQLERSGYEFAGYIPELPRQLLESMTSEQRVVTEPEFGPDALVLYLGRPLLNDVIEYPDSPDRTFVGRKPIWPSCTPVESAIHRAVRRIIVSADREGIILAPDIPLPEGAEFCRQVFFTIYKTKKKKAVPASIRSARRSDDGRVVLPDPRPTLGYVVGFPHVKPYGFRLLVVFGIGGTESLAFAELLRTQWNDVVGRALASPHPTLAIARFQPPEQMTMPVLSYDPEQLQAELLAEIELPDLGMSAPTPTPSRTRSSQRARSKPRGARKAPAPKGPTPTARQRTTGA